jgi:6-pyruvoyl tetrahydropterin synthase/QueD family protein
MAHRLSLTEGKCEQIHGHSWNVTLRLRGEVDESGKVLEFGDVKKQFREYLDTTFDHHLLLYAKDPILLDGVRGHVVSGLPGLQLFEDDPTTENFAKHLLIWATDLFDLRAEVEVWETAVNMAQAGSFYD